MNSRVLPCAHGQNGGEDSRFGSDNSIKKNPSRLPASNWNRDSKDSSGTNLHSWHEVAEQDFSPDAAACSNLDSERLPHGVAERKYINRKMHRHRSTSTWRPVSAQQDQCGKLTVGRGGQKYERGSFACATI